MLLPYSSFTAKMQASLACCISILLFAGNLLAFQLFSGNDESKTVSITTYTNATYSALTGLLRAYSLQQALDMDTGYNQTHLVLFTDGCLQPQGPQNCTATCNDNATAFASLQDLRNCMSYPTVALLYRDQNLSDASIDMANKLGIQLSRDNESSSPVSKLIQTCFSDYCNMLPGCNETCASLSQGEGPFNENDIAFKALVDIICEALPASVDSDIGGVGVV